MTSRDFCYWLQGFFEIAGKELTILNTDQIDLVKRHLNLVFKHEIDPSFGDPQHQGVLQQIHDGPGQRRDCQPVEVRDRVPLTPEEIERLLRETAERLDRERAREAHSGIGRSRDILLKC